MNKNEIGVHAGQIWQALSKEHRRWSYTELKDKIKLNDRDLNAALGWLARENKIEFCQCDGEDMFYLCLNVYIG